MTTKSRRDLYRHTGLVPYEVARRASVYAWLAGATFGLTVALFVWAVIR